MHSSNSKWLSGTEAIDDNNSDCVSVGLGATIQAIIEVSAATKIQHIQHMSNVYGLGRYIVDVAFGEYLLSK